MGAHRERRAPRRLRPGLVGLADPARRTAFDAMGAMRERMLRGELYRPDDPELLAGQTRCARTCSTATTPRGHDEQARARGAAARAARQRRRGRRASSPPSAATTATNITHRRTARSSTSTASCSTSRRSRSATTCWLATQRPAAGRHAPHRPGPAARRLGVRRADHHRRQRVARRRRHRLPGRRPSATTPWSAPERWLRATCRPGVVAVRQSRARACRDRRARPGAGAVSAGRRRRPAPVRRSRAPRRGRRPATLVRRF